MKLLIRNSLLGLGIFCLIAVMAVYFRFYATHEHAMHAIIESSYAHEDTTQQQLQQIVQDYPDLQLAVAATNHQSQTSYMVGDVHAPYNGASTLKLIVAAYYLSLVDSGAASLEQPIGERSASEALELLIRQSDNDVWDELRHALGEDNIQAFARTQGLLSYTGNGSNQITAAELNQFLGKLAKGSVLSGANQQLLFSWMQNTNNDNMIPAALEPNVWSAHKWGEVYGNLHDAAVIKIENRTVTLVVFTNNPASEAETKDRQAEAIRRFAAALAR